MTDAEWDELEARFRAARERMLADFHAPRFSPQTLIKLDISRGTLENWLARGFAKLDADQGRNGAKKWRRFSLCDAILLSSAAQFSAVGMPLAVAKQIAEVVCACIEFHLGRVLAKSPETELIIFRDAVGDWHYDPTNRAPADLPPLHLRFDIFKFATRVGHVLGVPMAAGTADDLRRAADSLDAEAAPRE